MIEETMGLLAESIEEQRKQQSGVVSGRVRSLDDPLGLGRVQVELHLACGDSSPWARIASPMAGSTHGVYFIPNEGDEVLVAFENGDVNAPYIVGSLWTAMARPPVSSPRSQVRAIRTPNGNQIVLQETPSAITIQTAPTTPESLPAEPSPTGPHHSVALSPSGIQLATPTQVEIAVGTTRVVVTPQATTVTVGRSTVRVSDAQIQLHAPTVDILGTESVSIRGPTIRLNS